MSRPSAVAAVTAALAAVIQRALDAGVGEGTVTTLPPGKAAKDGVNRVNLFLYEVTVDGACANTAVSGMIRPGERGNPPLALVLHYLLTPFVGSESSAAPMADLLLGYAMAALHNHAVLSRAEVRSALNRPDNDLDQQREPVRVSWQPLSVDDLSRLWTTFQMDFRTSVGYEASPVLVDSTPETAVRMPVLRRGAQDRGPEVASDPQPYPVLEWATLTDAAQTLLTAGNSYATGGPLATAGAELSIVGRNLSEVGRVELTESRSGKPTRVVPAVVQPTRLTVTLPQSLPSAGLYTLTAILSADAQATSESAPTTNGLPLALAPAVHQPVNPVTLQNGTGTATVRVTPPLADRQPALLLIASHPCPLVPPASASETLTFTVSGIAPGTYLGRVRVAGLDSERFPVSLA